MYHKHHTKGLFLQGKGEGDSSRRIYILTEELGLISARAQSVRSIYSKLRQGSQDFSFGEISLVHGKSGWRLVSVRVEKNFFELLKSSPLRVVMMVKVLNLIKKLVGEDEGQGNIFNLVVNFLDFLLVGKDEHLSLAECLVLLRILHSLGYMRDEPEFGLPLFAQEIEIDFLEKIAPRRSRIVELINESLKATNLT